MNDLLKNLPDEAQKKLREVAQPDWMDPVLAMLIDRRFSDENWIFERKVEPKLVAEIGFEEWTDYGKLRQPRFQGLRQDKDAQDVVREEAQ